MGTVRVPKERMLLPLAATNVGPFRPVREVALVAGRTLTWAPVSIRKRRFDMASITKSGLSILPAVTDATDDRQGSFPEQENCMVGGIDVRHRQNAGGSNKGQFPLACLRW